MLIRLKHINRVRSKGQLYWYYRRDGRNVERLPDDEAARIKRVLDLEAGWDVGPREGSGQGPHDGSLGALICQYRKAPEFKQLAPSTRKNYQHFLGLLETNLSSKPVAKIDSAWVHKLRDGMGEDMPRSANGLVAMLSILLNFGMLRGWCSVNPCKQVKKLKGGKSYEPWPEVAIERFRAEANPRLVWALELAIYTGQRRGDVLAMQWGHIEDGCISVAQQKTKARLLIPIHPDLAAVLEEIPRVGTTIVHRQDGRAYTGSGFSSMFRREQQKLGLVGLQFHGLRATAATRLVEAGATDREAMSVTGHKTHAMLTKYTRRAEQEKLAGAAIVKLPRRPPKP